MKSDNTNCRMLFRDQPKYLMRSNEYYSVYRLLSIQKDVGNDIILYISLFHFKLQESKDLKLVLYLIKVNRI